MRIFSDFFEDLFHNARQRCEACEHTPVQHTSHIGAREWARLKLSLMTHSGTTSAQKDKDFSSSNASTLVDVHNLEFFAHFLTISLLVEKPHKLQYSMRQAKTTKRGHSTVW
eukprot:1149107-Amphidinium_carterae.1